MMEEVEPDDFALNGIWAWWCIRSRKPGVPINVPPMPPLEEWPEEILETLERVSGKRIVRKKRAGQGTEKP